MRWQDEFSRAPMWFLQCHIGVGASNDPLGRGRAPWWYADSGVDWLVGEIRRAYAFGARRFWINRPGGDNGGDKPNAGASWLTMDAHRRGELTDKLADLLMEHPEIEIYWHVGSDLEDPRKFTSGYPGRPEGFYTLGDTSTPDRQAAARITIGGWLSVGSAGLSLDYSAQPLKREHMVALAESMRGDPFNFAIIGEAVPRVYVGDRWEPDYPALSRMPWVTTIGNYRRTFADPPKFDRKETRIIGWFSGVGSAYGDPRGRVAAVQEIMELGLIPVTCDEYMFRAAMSKARYMGDVTL